MTETKDAWICPALGVGFYAEGLDPRDMAMMGLSTSWNESKTHELFPSPHDTAASSVARDGKGIYFFFTNETMENPLLLSEDELYAQFRKRGERFFQYGFPITEEAKPMQLPQRTQENKPLKGLDLEDRIEAVKTHNSVMTYGTLPRKKLSVPRPDYL